MSNIIEVGSVGITLQGPQHKSYSIAKLAKLIETLTCPQKWAINAVVPLNQLEVNHSKNRDPKEYKILNLELLVDQKWVLIQINEIEDPVVFKVGQITWMRKHLDPK